MTSSRTSDSPSSMAETRGGMAVAEIAEGLQPPSGARPPRGQWYPAIAERLGERRGQRAGIDRWVGRRWVLLDSVREPPGEVDRP